MTVGQLLKSADNKELTEWQSCLWVESGDYKESKVKSIDKFRAMFGDRIIKNGDSR